MDQLIKDVESRKNGEKFHDFCIDDALFHLLKAKEILETDNPEDWFNQQREVSKLFVQLLPFLVSSNCTKSSQTDH